MVNGIIIRAFPDAYCIHNPDAQKSYDINGNCPEGFTRTANFTNPRCPPGYELVGIETQIQKIMEM